MCLNAFAHSKGLLPHWLSSPAPFHPGHKVFLFLLKVEKSSSLFSFIRLVIQELRGIYLFTIK